VTYFENQWTGTMAARYYVEDEAEKLWIDKIRGAGEGEEDVSPEVVEEAQHSVFLRIYSIG